ncbi:MAG: hypothetical protein A2Y23_12685 [Clostridiales bacterium GWB2_37_7]|nr:MAG: hypothetical protein A2Y23_12685 [Clostridiales bacterium GWB2_37_7]
MKIINAINKTYIEIYKSLKRFPVTIALSTSVVAVMIMISEMQYSAGYDSPFIKTLTRLAMVFALAIPLSLCIKLIFERYKQMSIAFKTLVYALAAGALVVYYFSLLKDLEMVSVVRYIALNFAFYLGFLFIPYINKKEDFELYIIKITSRFFITVIYAIVLFLGLAAIIFTVDKLLGIYVEEEFYYYTWLFIVGIFSPVFFLAGVPTFDESLEDYKYPNFFKILLLYIVMPLLVIYMGILYIYFAKIIITRVWPIGLVSHLVLWYSALCVAVIFLIEPIKNNIWVNKFIAFLPKLILPILVMMFISMGIRINAYGITENRYFVMILGIWVFCVMLYISFRKVHRNIILPISLSIITIISVFGPLSSFSVSKFSQNNRMSDILARNEMLVENKIIKPKADVAEKDKKEISAILRYFERNHSLNDVKYLEKGFALKDMEKIFGFAYEDSAPYVGNESYFAYNVNQSPEALDISGYEYFFDMRTYKNTLTYGDLKVEFVQQKDEVNIINAKDTLYSLKLSEVVKALKSKYPTGQGVDQKDMIFDFENEFIKLKFVFFSIYGSDDPVDGDIKIDGGDFYVLIELK